MANLPSEPVKPASPQTPASPDTEQSPASSELAKASESLKERIKEAKRHNNMPVDSALGSPNFEKDAADGRYDVPESEDED